MMTLRYPTAVPVHTPPAGGEPVLFALAAQGAPVISPREATKLNTLRAAIRARLTGPLSLTCHPHRVGTRCSVALQLTSETTHKSLHLLLTVSGAVNLPEGEDFEQPRWHITVTDAADLTYLLGWMGLV